MEFTLNKMQAVASSMFQEWYKHPETRERPWFEISGAAGTGKTTVVKHIIAELGLNESEVVFMAFVGKAALALRLSGVNGRTIHSVIYRMIKRYKRVDGQVVYQHGRPVLETVFEKVDDLPENIKLLVVDEGGMVGNDMALDILSFKIPLLVLGDLHQLPPVFGQGMFLQKPDVILNEIMRQHKDSAIIYLAQLATHGIPISYGRYNGGECRVIKKEDITDRELSEADLIICSTNVVRDQINWYVRKNICGIDSNSIVIGDKLICRQNCWDTILPDKSLGMEVALVNGLIGSVTSINRNPHVSGGKLTMDFKPEFSKISFNNVPVDPTYVLSEYQYRKTVNPMYSQEVMFELGYCSTCHLAQGSQYPSILVYLDLEASTSDYSRKWLYTAITRAQSHLVIAA
jgi:exodeoxyribonuclease-5